MQTSKKNTKKKNKTSKRKTILTLSENYVPSEKEQFMNKKQILYFKILSV